MYIQCYSCLLIIKYTWPLKLYIHFYFLVRYAAGIKNLFYDIRRTIIFSLPLSFYSSVTCNFLRGCSTFFINVSPLLRICAQVQHYERLSPLIPLKVPLGSFSNIRKGDCVITFSRREIYRLKVRFYFMHISSS